MTNNRVITFGCRLNTYESEIIRNNLNLAKVDNVTVFNTCAVTKEAERQAKQAIRREKKQNPDIKILVTGCAVQNDSSIFASMPEVDKIIGNEEKLSAKYYQNWTERVVVNDIMSIKETANHLVHSFEGRARAFLQVQNGCDHRCTFCIIPFARGNNRSVPLGVIVDQVRNLVNLKFNEIVFTGVDVTAYGSDLPGNPTFAQAIRRVLALIPDLKRLRLSSIDVAEIDEDLFNLMAYEKRLMPHFHISLQAGDNMILKRMKRRHTREQVIEFCQNLRKIRSDVSFGADIITGFPTETDEMFENTKKLILEADLQYLHVFPYSSRPGTPAARMPQIDKAIRKDRTNILRKMGIVQIQKFYQQNIGRKVQLLVEKNGLAHTQNFIPVKLPTDYYDTGILLNAELASFNQDTMFARIENF